MRDEGKLDTLFEFRFGDVFPADDVVSEWLLTIALAFNDIALTHGELEDAFEGPAYRYFYFLRLGIAHFHEAAKYLERTGKTPEVAAYVATLPKPVRVQYADCLERYRRTEGGLAQIRNLSVFHYPELVIRSGSSRPRLVQRVLRGLADATTSFFKSKTETIGTARLLFADDLASRLFTNGSPSDAELYALHEEIRAAITSFMGFANGAIEPKLADALDAGKVTARAGRPPPYAEAAEAMRGESESEGLESGT